MANTHTDRYVEKTFLWLVTASLVVHAALIAAILTFWSPEGKLPASEPIMVELKDLPGERPARPREEREVRRAAEEKQRVERETAPRGATDQERIVVPPRNYPAPAPPEQHEIGGMPSSPVKEAGPGREAPPGESLLKPKATKSVDIAKLFPGAEKEARLEEEYRRKFAPEVEEGETTFLNTDSIILGSFLRRFESAVYGVWRYPQEAAALGIQGVTPVRITFKRTGEIEKIVILESSGSRILDDEVLRTLRKIGPLGMFPKEYNKETFNLIAFFRYGIIGGASRGFLR